MILTKKLIEIADKKGLLDSEWIKDINNRLIDNILNKRILPKNKNNHIGIEIEFDSLSSKRDIAESIIEAD